MASIQTHLRRRDQPQFNWLFEYVREHADAGGILNHEDLLAPMLVSIGLEQEQRLDDLEERVDALEGDLNAQLKRDILDRVP